MAAKRAKQRIQVGSALWLAEERSSAHAVAETESEEFMFSVRNDVDWLNEHMAEIFSENQINVADIFKTPGKLRGKTPRTIRKANPLESRVPLSDVFSATPRGATSPFRQLQFEKPVATFKVAEDAPTQTTLASSSSQATNALAQQKLNGNPVNFLDSGYYGSQAVEYTQHTQATQATDPFYEATQLNSPLPAAVSIGNNDEMLSGNKIDDEARRSTTASYKSAEEGQTAMLNLQNASHGTVVTTQHNLQNTSFPVLSSPTQQKINVTASPQKRSPDQITRSAESLYPMIAKDTINTHMDEMVTEDTRSPSPRNQSMIAELKEGVEQDVLRDESADPMLPVATYSTEVNVSTEEPDSPQSEGSSPMRPIVRKSSLNFASLPAREPLTSKKSIGNRVSRTSQLEPSRMSYYGRHAGGKSVGNAQVDDDEMEIDDENNERPNPDEAARIHNKTSTRRLQDQISMLGKSQPSRTNAKSISATQANVIAQNVQTEQIVEQPPAVQPASPSKREKPPPGAFPDDEEDSWIGPSNSATAAVVAASVFSPRPVMMKSHTTDVMEDIHGKTAIGISHELPRQVEAISHQSPVQKLGEQERNAVKFGHMKSASTSVLRSPVKVREFNEARPISVSNPTPVPEPEPTSPSKTPSRTYRGSPLKAAKDKFSSILKTSRGLFASSAAISADAKSNLTSSPSRHNLISQPSTANLDDQPLYPDLTLTKTQSATSQVSQSPARSVRKTRASTEREDKRKHDEAKEAKELKEAKKVEEQFEKARQKVKDEARLFRYEQEKVAALQKEVAAKQEQGRMLKQTHAELARSTRSSPKKLIAQLETEPHTAPAAAPEEVETQEAAHSMPPPSLPIQKSQIGRLAVKRPVKPAKEPIGKAKPPTVIRVDTGSQRGHQYQQSISSIPANLQDSLVESQTISSSKASQGTLKHKVSTSSIQSKTSNSSFKSGATKALEAAARKKEQDDLAAQKKREAKLEVERQRAAIKEEEKRKEDLQRRQEAERQREIQRERERAVAAADAKKAAARQAMDKRRLELERAKENRPPPPAVRPQPSTESLLDKALPPLPQVKHQRMNSIVPRPQEDQGRVVNQASTKFPPKRPLQQDVEESNNRPGIQRNGPSYQQNEVQPKRRKTNDIENDDDEEMIESLPKMSAPPIRQSSVRPKDVPVKNLFASGYTNAVPTAANLQRSTLIAQHSSNHAKTAHPLDMTTVSKAPIAFAGTNQQTGQSYKTPARPANTNGKSAAKSAKSSPRYPNGENIVLQEINTDSEDEDDDDKGKMSQPSWVASPALKAQLTRQEGMDPSTIFGGPKELDMEAVFSKNKEKFPKFRARTSSANWSGEDRLTQDEIRKDVEARDKLRRQGFWTYDHIV